MKTTLFLVLVGGSFVICSCQQQTPPPTPEETPVAPSVEVAAPIVVTPVKSAANVSGGIAPSNVKGKTIVFKYANGETKNFDYFNGQQRTHIDKKGRTAVTGVEGDYVFYTKTSGSSAKVELNGSDGGELWILHFDTPTTGTAIENEVDYDGSARTKSTGITFTIK